MPSKQEEIREEIAKFNYYYPDGKPKVRQKWETLSDEEKKPYLDVAKLQVSYLHSKGVVIKVERELSTDFAYEDATLNLAARGERLSMLRADFGAFESLI